MSNVGTAACTHYWMLATPDEEVVHGRCKRCGETRDYPASLDGASREGMTREAASLGQVGSGLRTTGGAQRAN